VQKDPNKSQPSSPEAGLRELRKRLRRRILKIISIVTGISIGSFILIIGLALGAMAIFVRTDTFQIGLRDRILQVSQRQFDAVITYESAKVSIFRLEPRIEFFNVHFQPKKTKVGADIGRVSAGISIIFSLPLLFFKQFHLSSAEIEGLRYHLTDLKDIEVWLDSARPKSVFIPSAFQTSIGELLLKNIEFDVDLEKSDGLAQGVHGKMQIENVNIELSARDTRFSGLIHFKEIRNPKWGPFSGDLRLENGSHTQKRTRLGLVRFESETEFVEVSGEIRRWSNPILDLKGKLSADVRHLVRKLPSWGGKATGSFSLQGPWQALEGMGSAKVENLEISGKRWDLVQGKFKLKFPEFDLSELEGVSGSEKFLGTAKISLSPEASSSLDLKISNANLGSYLGLVDEDLSKWKGDVQGSLKYQGSLLTLKGKFQWDLSVEDFFIRSFRREIEILHFPKVTTQGEGDLESDSVGGFSAQVATGGSKWTGNSRWDPTNFELNWDANFPTMPPGSSLGELYGNKIALLGAMKGSYKGPKSRLVMSVDNRMSFFALNNYKLTNFQGQLRLENRVLSAAPLKSDQLDLNGGIFLAKGATPDEFSNLQFKSKKASAEFLLVMC